MGTGVGADRRATLEALNETLFILMEENITSTCKHYSRFQSNYLSDHRSVAAFALTRRTIFDLRSAPPHLTIAFAPEAVSQ